MTVDPAARLVRGRGLGHLQRLARSSLPLCTLALFCIVARCKRCKKRAVATIPLRTFCNSTFLSRCTFYDGAPVSGAHLLVGGYLWAIGWVLRTGKYSSGYWLHFVLCLVLPVKNPPIAHEYSPTVNRTPHIAGNAHNTGAQHRRATPDVSFLPCAIAGGWRAQDHPAGEVPRL